MSKAFFVSCSLAVLLLSGAWAQEPEKGGKPTFQVPKGWKEIEAGAVSFARFQIVAGDAMGLMTITGLNGDGGGLAANINRWRVQVGLEALEEKDALKSAVPIKVDGISGLALDLIRPDMTGKGTPRMLAAIVKQGDKTWFFKLTGPSSLVVEQKMAFDGFMKSVRFGK